MFLATNFCNFCKLMKIYQVRKYQIHDIQMLSRNFICLARKRGERKKEGKNK